MKNIIIIIGTVILGGFIVNTMIMGDAGTMQAAAQTIIDKGLAVIEGISYPTI